MKILAEVRFTSWKNVEFLMKAFFKNINENNKIFIKGDTAKVEFFAEDSPPKDLMSALVHCNVKHIEYDMTEVKSIITAKDETFQIETHNEANLLENGEEAENHKTKEDLIQMLETIPVGTVIEDRIDKVVSWIGIDEGEKELFFVDLLTAATQANKINWENLAEKMKSKYSKNFDKMKRGISKYISYLFNSELRLMKFLQIVAEYIK